VLRYAAPVKDLSALTDYVSAMKNDIQLELDRIFSRPPFVGSEITDNVQLKSDRFLSPRELSRFSSSLSILKKKSSPLELLTKPPEWLFGFHNELRTKFDRFFSGRYWWHVEPPTEKYLLCPGVPPYGSTVNLDSIDIPPQIRLKPVEQLMIIAGRAVIAEKEKFGVCERCTKPFIAEKNPRRKFCSPTCAQYVRTTRYRQKQRQS
jgi:hypothetical protein